MLVFKKFTIFNKQSKNWLYRKCKKRDYLILIVETSKGSKKEFALDEALENLCDFATFLGSISKLPILGQVLLRL